MLEVKNLRVKFKKNEVLRGVSCTFDSGIYGLLGPNGAGKTTLIRSIAGLYRTKNGEIIYNGTSTEKSKTFLSKLGYLPQSFGLFKELKPVEALTLLSNLKELDKKAAQAEAMRVLEIVNLTDSINKKIGAFSGGMLRRLGIAQAFLGDPEILIFDEPTAGLDPEERLRFKNIIARLPQDKTVIISTHIVEDVEAICQNIIVMNNGTVVKSGSCCEIEKAAEGKVYLVPVKQGHTLGDDCVIQKYTERDGEQLMRVLSNRPLDFESEKASIEDGYICLLRGI